MMDSSHISIRQIRGAEEELTQCLGRRPDEREIAWCLDIDVATLRQLRANMVLELPVLSELTPQREPDISAVKQAFLQLTEQERVVLSLLYSESLSVTEVAHLLQLRPFHVEELRDKALHHLRRFTRPLQLVSA